MNEAGFTRSIFKSLPNEIYKWKIMNMMQNGVPDCWFSGPTGDLWVEMKYREAPKRDSTQYAPDLSDLQSLWLGNRFKEGRNVGVVLGTDKGCRIFQNSDWQFQITNKDLIHTRKDIKEWIIKSTLG